MRQQWRRGFIEGCVKRCVKKGVLKGERSQDYMWGRQRLRDTRHIHLRKALLSKFLEMKFHSKDGVTTPHELLKLE